MKKVILLVLTLSFVFNQYPVMNVEANEMSKGEELKERYFEKKEKEREQIEEECKKVRQRYDTIEDVSDKIKEFGIEDDVVVRIYYNGDNLTVQLTEEVSIDEFNMYITEKKIAIEYVEYSKKDLEACEKKCNDLLENSDSLIVNEKQALKTISGVNINYDENCIDVYISDRSKNNLEMLKVLFDMEEIRFVSEEETMPTATSVQLGRGYYYTYQGKPERASIGYRAKMTNVATGEIMYGFVTCGHIISSAMLPGYAVYYDNACTKKLGNIKLITYNSTTKCDYAFIKVTSDYSMSNIVYYNTVYGRTENGTRLSSKYATKEDLLNAKDTNTTIYKAGSSSYLTSGKIKIVAEEIVSYGVELSKMIKTDIYATGGDSGGVVYGYIKRNNKYYWLIIGIISCGNDEYTWVQPAYRAINYYSTYKILPY